MKIINNGFRFHHLCLYGTYLRKKTFYSLHGTFRHMCNAIIAFPCTSTMLCPSTHKV